MSILAIRSKRRQEKVSVPKYCLKQQSFTIIFVIQLMRKYVLATIQQRWWRRQWGRPERTNMFCKQNNNSTRTFFAFRYTTQPASHRVLYLGLKWKVWLQGRLARLWRIKFSSKRLGYGGHKHSMTYFNSFLSWARSVRLNLFPDKPPSMHIYVACVTGASFSGHMKHAWLMATNSCY